MHIRRWVGITAIATGAVALSAGAGLGVAAASSRSAVPSDRTVTADGPTPDVLSAAWQGDYAYTVPTGTTNLFFHYSCPTNYVAVSGSFHESTPTGAPVLNGSFPRTDITPLYSQWGWVFTWASPGSPAGYSITFDVFCTNA
jgi:hypothetical protein